MNEPKRPAPKSCDDWWPEPALMGGSLHSVSSDEPQRPPVVLVPDRERGGWREHQAVPTKRAIGFR